MIKSIIKLNKSMNQIKVKVPAGLAEKLITQVPDQNDRNRLLVAFSKIVHRSLSDGFRFEQSRSSIYDYDSDSAFAVRMNKFKSKHPQFFGEEYSFPVELIAEEKCATFLFKKSGANNDEANRLIELGKSIRLWDVRHPAYNPYKAGKAASPTAMAALEPLVIVPMNSLVTTSPISLTLNVSKPIFNSYDMTKFIMIEKHKDSKRIISQQHYKFMQSAQLPEFEELEAKGKVMVENGTKNDEGKPYHWDSVKEEGKVNLKFQALLFSYTDHSSSVTKEDYALDVDGNMHPSRTYTSFSLMPKWIREEIMVGGEKISGIDASALHPNVLYRLLSEKGITCELLKGDAHTKIAALLNVSREEAKLINLTYWNHGKKRFGDDVLKQFHEYMTQNHPDVLQFLQGLKDEYSFVKNNGESLSEHEYFCRVAFMFESIMMADVVEALVDEGIPCNQCYDAVYVPESKRARAVEIFKSVLKMNGIPSEVK